MIKHVGKHNDRKVVIIYRQIPGEDHMCLIAYSDVLPRLIHDEVMATLESAVGQQENELANALHRHTMADGRNTLEALHNERFMKKVQTSQVIVTPAQGSSCRLDELNTILTEMAKGEEAVARLAEIDKQGGLQTKKVRQPNDLGDPVVVAPPSMPAPVVDVLSDANLAEQRLQQAAQMKNEATALLAEAARLEGEAKALSPAKAKSATTTKKTVKTANAPAKAKATKVKEG